MTERWLPVVGWEGLYEVSDLGRVRSLDRLVRTPRSRTGATRLHPGRILEPLVPNADAGYRYPCVGLKVGPRGKRANIHSLVLAAFVGPRPPEMVSRHLNGDRTDSRLLNLAYGTASENMLDAVAHGTHANASKTHCKNKHPLSGDNLKVGPRGGRCCRACWRNNSRRCNARKAGVSL